MKIKILIIIVGFIFSSSNIYSQNYLYKEIEKLNKSEIVFEKVNVFQVAKKDVELLNNFKKKNEVVFFRYNPAQFRSAEKAISLEIPLNNKQKINLKLIKIENNHNYKLTTNDGSTYNPNKSIKHYRGVIFGDPNSLATLTFFNDKLMGIIATDEGNFNIVFDKSSKNHILYNDKNLTTKSSFNCLTSNDKFIPYYPEVLFAKKELKKERTETFNLKYVRLYFETEFDIYQNLDNSITKVEAFVTMLYNQIATFYRNENIFTELSEIHVWATADPYTGTNITDLLNQFQAERTNLNGDLGQLLTFRDLNSGLAASFNGLCNASTKNKLSVCGIDNHFDTIPKYSYTVTVSAHEFGHLFGSRHTHACVWNGNNTAIDGCAPSEGDCERPPIPQEGGTIMSYCHLSPVNINLNLGFGPQPGNVIRNEVEESECLFYYKIKLYGTSKICNSSNATFTLHNVPSGASVSWFHSNNLSCVSGSNGTSYTVKADESGEGWVEANINGNVIRETLLIEKTPSFSIIGDNQLNLGEIGFAVITNNECNNTTTLWSCSGHIQNINGTGTTARYKAGQSNGYGTITATLTNFCGSTKESLSVKVQGSIYYRIYPNPATNAINVDLTAMIEKQKTENPGKSNVYEIQLWNDKQLLQTTRTTEPKVQIPLSKFPSGYYYIKIIHNGKTTSKKFFKE